MSGESLSLSRPLPLSSLRNPYNVLDCFFHRVSDVTPEHPANESTSLRPPTRGPTLNLRCDFLSVPTETRGSRWSVESTKPQNQDSERTRESLGF